MPKRMNAETFDHIKQVGDGAAVFVTVGTIFNFLPPLAALVTIVWTAIRIYETDTVRRMLGKDPL